MLSQRKYGKNCFSENYTFSKDANDFLAYFPHFLNQISELRKEKPAPEVCVKSVRKVSFRVAIYLRVEKKVCSHFTLLVRITLNSAQKKSARTKVLSD